jgi:hypothetical protein
VELSAVMETIKTRLAGKKVSYEKRDKMKRKKKKEETMKN